MHDVKGLISKIKVLQTETEGLSSAVICPLAEGFGLLPITDGLAKELDSLISKSVKLPSSPLSELTDGVHALALRISKAAPVSFFSTEYFGGKGGQDAVSWSKGLFGFKPRAKKYRDREWPNSSVSQSLKAIGIVAEDEKDEFDTLDLGRHRETHRWADAYAGFRIGV